MNWLSQVIAWLPEVLPWAAGTMALVLGVGVVFREPRSLAHLSFGLGLVLAAAEACCAGMAVRVPTGQESSLLFWECSRIAVAAVLPSIWLFFSLVYSRGNYHEFLRRRWAMLALFFMVPLVVLLAAWASLIELVRVTIRSGEQVLVLGAGGYVLEICFLLGAVLILLNLEWTFRSAVGAQRWRIKFVVLGVGFYFAVRIYAGAELLLDRTLRPSLDAVKSMALAITCGLIGFSVIRTRMVGVQVYPSHAVLRNSLTMMLVGAYLLVVGVLAQAVNWFGGTAAYPVEAFVVLTSLVALGVLLMSDRLRHELQRFVSRHWRRPRHDYREVWHTFTERIGPQVTPEGLSAAAVRWLSETFNVLSATVWVADSNHERLILAASTVAGEKTTQEVPFVRDDFAQLVGAFRKGRSPPNIEARHRSWAKRLREANPVQFPEHGRNRYALPLVAREECLGVVVLGDRVRGERYSHEDLDLLRCIGDQLGQALLALRLTERLVEAREMEAFQAMSTFFVHDLKNTSSTLSLMLQNLPKYHDNAEYREDALRSLGQCVGHIGDLINQLSVLRKGLELRCESSDLSAVVLVALKPIEICAGDRLLKNLAPVPPASLDAGQIQRVVTNLVLNALDAIGTEGRVHVNTFVEDGWVGLVVADDGTGMSTEFVRKSLFRPFHTTKKSGLGIGLFHSKLIVEAHGGRISVESQPSKGTRFKVLLPCCPQEAGVGALGSAMR